MARPKGIPDMRWIVPEALEDIGAVNQLLGDRYRPIDPELSRAHGRAARAYFASAKTIRAQQMGNG